jgi:hypothetical protein
MAFLHQDASYSKAASVWTSKVLAWSGNRSTGSWATACFRSGFLALVSPVALCPSSKGRSRDLTFTMMSWHHHYSKVVPSIKKNLLGPRRTSTQGLWWVVPTPLWPLLFPYPSTLPPIQCPKKSLSGWANEHFDLFT